jgi:hypothetical protein
MADKTASTAVEQPPSVAIMPFVNSSGDPDFEYFSDGMTAWLIGTAHLAPREDDRAFQWFETAYQERDPRLPELRRRFLLEEDARLVADPRYRDLLRRMNVPEP